MGLNTDPCLMPPKIYYPGNVWPIKIKQFYVGNLLNSFLIVLEDYHVQYKFLI